MKALRIADQNVRHSEAICEVGENWQRITGGPLAQEPGMGDRGIILIVTGVSGSRNEARPKTLRFGRSHFGNGGSGPRSAA
jgi:hypothetical protein